jgi:hypothetical protein
MLAKKTKVSEDVSTGKYNPGNSDIRPSPIRKKRVGSTVTDAEDVDTSTPHKAKDSNGGILKLTNTFAFSSYLCLR